MKPGDVQVGATYLTGINGKVKVARVVVLERVEMPEPLGRRAPVKFAVRVEGSGALLSLRTAAALRPAPASNEVEKEEERAP